MSPLGKGGGYRRSGSVLVLVMTLLSILFVLGVAFLASMNFEAEMLAAARKQQRLEQGIDAVIDELTGALEQRLAGSDEATTSGTTGAGAAAAVAGAMADLPTDGNVFAAVEPYWERNVLADPNDDQLAYRWFTDLPGLYGNANPNATQWQRALIINTALNNGQIIGGKCDDRSPPLLRGTFCDPADPNACQPGGTCLPLSVADADGDGIVDSLFSDGRSDLGLSRYQTETLSTAVNGQASTAGEVSLALRVVPHGGMVNLNEAHPRLIQNVLGLPRWPAKGEGPDPNMGYFVHQPTQFERFYQAAIEEPSLRRRMFLPPGELPATQLQGNPLLTEPDRARGDLFNFLFPPPRPGVLETLTDHRFWMAEPDETLPTDPNFLLRAARLEPFTSLASASLSTEEYDRRHLVTTTSHDDLLSRGGRVQTPAGMMDLREAMIAVNRSTDDPGGDPNCERLLPFEIANYPHTLDNNTTSNEAGEVCACPTQEWCSFNVRKGRLKLSLLWLDQMKALIDTPNPDDDIITEPQWQRIIHDAFYMLVRNAAQTVPAPADDPTSNCTADAQCAAGSQCTLAGTCTFVCASDLDCTTNVGPGSTCTTSGMMAGTCTQPCKSNAECVPTAVCTGNTAAPGICEYGAPYWQDQRCNVLAGGCRPGEICVPDAINSPTGYCGDPITLQRRSLALVSRTAASLTANMIDFVDVDDVPTRIPLRSFDFNNDDFGDCFGGGAIGEPCKSDADCAAGFCRFPEQTVGRAFGETDRFGNSTGMVRRLPSTPPPQPPPAHFVYGIERQPFMTEVATYTDGMKLQAWAVELFNPFDGAIVGSDYFLVEDDPGSPALDNWIRLTGFLQPGEFAAYYTDLAGTFFKPLEGRSATDEGDIDPSPAPFTFANGWTLYLVRRVQYPDGSGGLIDVDIVVDQFTSDGTAIGVVDPNGDNSPAYVTMERPVSLTANPPTPWKAPVPDTGETADPAIDLAQSLGSSNKPTNGSVRPAEIAFADTGSFTKPLPPQGTAFPTTGAMLLNLRHANRSTTDFINGQVTNLAFTTWLNDETRMPPMTGNLATINESGQVDNGRMPVFDVGAPGIGAGAGRQFSAHHMQPWLTPPNQQGRTITLPWGQLVFDYFTALPLSGGGPYRKPPGAAATWTPGQQSAQPRVDQNGLRVHGRIDINAAPWTVLAGLPRMPINQFPAGVRAQLATNAPKTCNGGSNDGQVCFMASECPGGTCDPSRAVDQFLAQSIVAYREQRQVVDEMGNTTGDFGTGTGGAPPLSARGWNVPNVDLRRGTGFLSVGELANLRHPGATAALLPDYRIDFNVGGPGGPTPDFLQAAAGMIMLSDWVTVRSHVATVYGVIRGGVDDSYQQDLIDQGVTAPAQLDELLRQDTDSRAIRFQQTVDRLPALTGESSLRRIGQRVVRPYTDVTND